MIKVQTFIFSLLLICFLLVGCSTKTNNNKKEVNDVSLEDTIVLDDKDDLEYNTNESMEEINNDMENGILEPVDKTYSDLSNEEIDVDLTQLSSTLVYAEVYNIMVSPDRYIGKTVKMRGQYYSTYYDKTEKYYHYVLIEDAAACCQQGLEFMWTGEHTFPDDYPADGSEVELVGTFSSYEELGVSYSYISTEEIIIVK